MNPFSDHYQSTATPPTGVTPPGGRKINLERVETTLWHHYVS